MPVSVIPLKKDFNTSSLFIEKFIDIQPSNVFLGTIKYNEWKGNQAIIVRFYEAMGISTDVEINFNPLLRGRIKSIKSVDLIERNTTFNHNWNKNGNLKFKLEKFEICTFELSFDN
jgi:alpha-mannosidase